MARTKQTARKCMAGKAPRPTAGGKGAAGGAPRGRSAGKGMSFGKTAPLASTVMLVEA